jgi:hypothetical protein
MEKYVLTTRAMRPTTAVHVLELVKVFWEASLPSSRRAHEREALSASRDAVQ